MSKSGSKLKPTFNNACEIVAQLLREDDYKEATAAHVVDAYDALCRGAIPPHGTLGRLALRIILEHRELFDVLAKSRLA